ncbi:uncharacterized protein LOC125658133 isoform X2 [Ostrea edulis]|nr:uncharacterized protein LOC125658133 isoform X2 [Ostrea edulis]
MMIYQYRVRYKEEEGVYSVRSAKASNLLDLVEQYRLAAVGKDGITSIYTKETALSHLMYPIQWPHKYKDWCYHGLLGRNEAEGVLRESFQKSKLNSPFLIRDSYSDPGRLIVSSMFVKKSDESHKFDHRLINFTDNTFEALTCKGANLQALAKSIEERYRHRGDLMDLKVTYREGVHGVDTDVLEHHLPPSIKKMDESAIKIFREALEEGHENYHHVRVMVVGHHGAGKSSLTKRLLREKYNEVRSTDGVEIYTKQGRFQLNDHKWIKYDGKQEYEIDTRERIARYLTQRFPQGVPTYLSLREVSQLRCDEKENTSHYAMNVEIPSISKQESYTKRPPKISMLTRGPTDKLQVSSPKAPPKAYPDPRVSTSRRMSSESEDDDEIEENIYNNNFTRVILDLKSKFSPSSENPKSPDYDDMKGSDYEPGDNEDTVERQHSFDFANDDKEQALKEELGELLHMSSKFLQNETGCVTFWDFAGQTVFQTTHQAFMSSKAVYLLVTDVSRPMTDIITDDDDCQSNSAQKSVGDFLKFWLNTIHTYCSESQRGSPKVLVVSTHKDKTENAERETEEHHRDIKRVVKKKMLSPHLVPEMFCVDCNDPDDEVFDEIRSKILEIAEKENILSQQIPTSWIYLEQKITDLRREGKKVLNISEMKKLNKFCVLHLKDEKEIKVFLQFHHAIGNILYYNEKGLDDIIILNPQWLVDAFKCLITSDKFLGISQSDSLLREMKENGHLSNEMIETLWSEKEDNSYLENKEHIIKILERMDIISRPRRYLQGGETVQETCTFLVPCMMNSDSSNVRGKWLTSTNNMPALGFHFKDEFMPPAVFYRLLAACMAKFPAVEQNDIPLVFADTAVFRLDKLNFLLLTHDEFLIRARVLTFPSGARQGSSIHYTIKKFLEESLTIILEIYTSCTACPDHKLTKKCADCKKCNANFPFRIVVQCSYCSSPDKTYKGLHQWEDLESNESVVCADHDDEVHIIESDDILSYWACPKVVDADKADNLSMSLKRSESVLEKPLSYRTLGRLARRISGCWDQVAYSLGLDNNFVETAKINFPHLASDRCFHVLRSWFDKSPKEKRKLKTLYDVFANVDVDRESLTMLDTVEIKWEENKYLNQRVSKRGIDIICNRLGKKSYQLAIELGLTPEETERIQMDFRTSIDRSREYIIKWRQKVERPTYQDLLQALAAVDVDYSDVLTLIY